MRTKQDYGTPWEFIRACEAKFGPLTFDFAASNENVKAPHWWTSADDALSLPPELWAEVMDPEGTGWLNPPFERIEPWARRCAEVAPLLKQGKLLFLTPASVATDWFWAHVQPHAYVLALSPRIIFDGTPINPKTGKTDPYPKDLMLSVYGWGPGFARWRWKT